MTFEEEEKVFKMFIDDYPIKYIATEVNYSIPHILRFLDGKIHGCLIDNGLFKHFKFNKQYNIHKEFRKADKLRAINLIDQNRFPGYKVYYDYNCRYFTKISIFSEQIFDFSTKTTIFKDDFQINLIKEMDRIIDYLKYGLSRRSYIEVRVSRKDQETEAYNVWIRRKDGEGEGVTTEFEVNKKSRLKRIKKDLAKVLNLKFNSIPKDLRDN